MGSPNFFTGCDCILNFGIEFDDSIDQEDFCMNSRDDIGEKIDAVNDSLTFFRVLERPGYHSGLQIYLEQLHSVEWFWEYYARFWSSESEIGYHGDDGEWNEIILDSCYQTAIEQGLFSIDNLRTMINEEQDIAENKIKAIAKEFYLGEVVGRGFTSSVNYEWLTA